MTTEAATEEVVAEEAATEEVVAEEAAVTEEVADATADATVETAEDGTTVTNIGAVSGDTVTLADGSTGVIA